MNYWIKSGSLLAFPYKWQEPASTEKWIYEFLSSNSHHSKFVEFVSFPWATLIDLIDRGMYEEAEPLIKALQAIPPKTTLIRATACQHVNISKALEWLYSIKITNLYWAHKKIKSNFIDGIKLHPLPLYPLINFKVPILSYIPLKKRKYLFSFVGAYDRGCYISDVREKLFNLPVSENSIIIKRDSWHLEGLVYKSQVLGESLNIKELNDEAKKSSEYASILMNSVYSLCPSGAGCNTIRYWESLAYGCIPVVLSDLWDKPPISDKWVDLKHSERDVDLLINRLENHDVAGLGSAPNFFGSSHDFSSDWLSYIVDELFDKKNILEWSSQK